MQRCVFVIFVAQVDGHVEGQKKTGGVHTVTQRTPSSHGKTCKTAAVHRIVASLCPLATEAPSNISQDVYFTPLRQKCVRHLPQNSVQTHLGTIWSFHWRGRAHGEKKKTTNTQNSSTLKTLSWNPDLSCCGILHVRHHHIGGVFFRCTFFVCTLTCILSNNAFNKSPTSCVPIISAEPANPRQKFHP